MRAIIWTNYGTPDVLKPGEVAKPTAKDNEVLIRIHATTASTADCELRAFKASSALWVFLRLYIGLIKPTRIKILGQELAGDIEAAGKDVTLFKAGDPVFASTGLHLGAYAEYICLPETAMMGLKPANITYDEAAVLPLGGLEALHILKQADIQSGEKVLVIGAGGTIGTFGVQVAKLYGAEVTALDSTEKLEMLRSIGADHVIDYTREDFAKGGPTYDVIFDAPGKSSFSRSKGALKGDGLFLSANPGFLQPGQGVAEPRTSRRKVVTGYTSPTKADLAALTKLVEAGKIRPVIDRRYPLEQMAEAHRYAETGHKKGNIVVTVAPG